MPQEADPAVPCDIDPLSLFAGAGPTRFARPPHESGNGWADVNSLLLDSQTSLPAAGSIVVLLENPLRRRLRSIRCRPPPARRGAEATRADAHRSGPTLRALVAGLRKAGFTTIAEFGVSPSTETPDEIRPLTLRGRWFDPAFLVTASRDRSVGTSVMDRIIQGVEGTESSGGPMRSGRLLRVLNSTRGKSIAFVESHGARVIVRIARSQVMLADEARSFQVLRLAHANPAVRTQVPRPLYSGVVEGVSYFAQSHVAGVPLSTRISEANRGAYLREVDAFLRALNAGLEERPTARVDDIGGPEVGQPMVEFVLRHVDDATLRAKARSLIGEALHGAMSRLGIVHGDFGTGNIMVDGPRITGVIDWEAARSGAPPVLDAFNYLDSAHRSCSRGLSIVDTLPLLAHGAWPVAGELDFLREFFRYCDIDFRFRRGFALLYFLFHIGPQLRYSSMDDGPKHRLEQVLRRI